MPIPLVQIKHGYHVNSIPRGVYGETSKILEEALEVIDAEQQDNRIMLLLELSDLYGAMNAVVRKHGFTMHDLATMAEATERAFSSGERQCTQKPTND